MKSKRDFVNEMLMRMEKERWKGKGSVAFSVSIDAETFKEFRRMRFEIGKLGYRLPNRSEFATELIRLGLEKLKELLDNLPGGDIDER